MLHNAITDAGDFPFVHQQLEFLCTLKKYGKSELNLYCLGATMMKLDKSNRRDWQGFTRILEVMTFLDKMEAHSAHEAREVVDQFCELPPNPGDTMSMEEVVFWAGVATGMEYERRAAEEEGVDASGAEKMLVYSSLFAHSIKNAIVDLALGDLEVEEQPLPRYGEKVGR